LRSAGLDALALKHNNSVKASCLAGESVSPSDAAFTVAKLTGIDLPEKLRDQIARELAKKNP
jgi:hypothetical protein